MAPIADSYCMPSTFVPTTQNMGGVVVTGKSCLSRKANFLIPPHFERALTGTAGPEERTQGGKNAETEVLLRGIQPEQQA